MPLLGLPTELIGHIILDTIPEDFENVMLACKAIHAAGCAHLEYYNTRRRRFKHFAFSERISSEDSLDGDMEDDLANDEDADEWDSVTTATGFKIQDMISLLGTIAEEPRIARFIETADLRGEESWEEREDDEPTFPRIREEDHALREMVLSSSYLRQLEASPEAFLWRMSNKAQGHAAVFLMTLLPNLRGLTPPAEWGFLELSNYMEHEQHVYSTKSLMLLLDLIVAKANDPSLPDASLSKLEIVYPNKGSGYDERQGLIHFDWFLALNSLREFYAGSVIARRDGYTGFEYEPRFATYSRRLDTIELYASVMSAPAFANLLSRAPNVKYLRFGHETKWHGCGWNWDIGGNIYTIQQHAGATLEELSITILDGTLNNHGTTLPNMHGFQRLKILDMDVTMFTGIEFNEKNYRLEEDDEEPPMKRPEDEARVRLVDYLPQSLETFGLYTHSCHGTIDTCLRKLFEGFAKERHQKLPHLEKVTLMCPMIDAAVNPSDRQIREHNEATQLMRYLSEAGVSINHRPTTYVPKWARQFCRNFDVSRV